MPQARLGSIQPGSDEPGSVELHYECFGREEDPTLVLVMGLGVQMIFWEDRFCAALAERGHRVVRFDNRDVGLSSKLDALGSPDVAEIRGRAANGQPLRAPYSLDDMADDVAGLLDFLGVDAAHVVGASMGGMVAQLVALRHPARVRGLVSIMSSTGDPDLPGPDPEAAAMLAQPLPPGRQAYVERGLRNARICHGPETHFPFESERVRRRAERAYERGIHPPGYLRQLLAIMTAPPRSEALRRLQLPALVIHGNQDPLVPVACGIATAKAIPDARLEIVEGMGHDLPTGAWPRIIDAICELTGR